jgi:hypothetical protein
MSAPEQGTAVGVFSDRTHAEYAVDGLLAAGFTAEQIGFLTPDAGPVEVPPLDEGNKSGEGAGAGAAAGGLLGAALGAALATIVIPGVGTVIAGGLLAGAIGGAVVGATGGGTLGALIGLGIPEEKAHHYHHEFHSGRTLVTVQAGERYHEALAILNLAAERPETEARAHHPDLSRLEGPEGPAPGTGSAFVPEP